jgi:hypothetical protein
MKVLKQSLQFTLRGSLGHREGNPIKPASGHLMQSESFLQTAWPDMAASTLFDRGQWPCAWIHPTADFSSPGVMAFRRIFQIDRLRVVRVHVTADEDYDLYLDGHLIGRGPERGDPSCWFFESYDLALDAGSHCLFARVRALGPAAPRWRISLRPGFLLAPEGMDLLPEIGTGVAEWECRILPGYSFEAPFQHDRFSIGYNCIFDGERLDPEAEAGSGDGWQTAVRGLPGAEAHRRNRYPATHFLVPAMLPPPRRTRLPDVKVRALQSIHEKDPTLVPVIETAGDNLLAADWAALILNQKSLVIAAGTRLRALVDLENYFCTELSIRLGASAGAVVSVRWAESLFEDTDFLIKGRRDLVEGKFFFGIGDKFLAADTRPTECGPIFWRAGRYVQIEVETQAVPLTIESFDLRETRHPADRQLDFTADDPRLAEVVPPALRTLECSAHDALVDGPHYEQMMWAGDGVQTILCHYVTHEDTALVKKAILLFDHSRTLDGLTRARWPARDTMVIPPYSLSWVRMVHDFALWRNEPDFVRARLPGVRAVCDAFLGFRGDDGLIRIDRGWNFVDWVPGWVDGVPPGADGGANATLNWQFVNALTLVATLEDSAGDPELAARARRIAAETATTCIEAFWNHERRLFADEPGGSTFSEHGQCFAVLSGLLPGALRQEIALPTRAGLDCSTISFRHFLFEALAVLGHADAILDGISGWREYAGYGLTTLPEGPEPSRSDCHAWGAHPLYHLVSTILGLRPASPGFTSVAVRPQLGRLQAASGSIPHPSGRIGIRLQRVDNGYDARISLPPGISASVVCGGQNIIITEPENHCHLDG